MVNIASEAGLRGGAAGIPYIVSKYGVVGLIKGIAFYYRDKGIRCNAVCPGVETGIGVGSDVPHQEGLLKVIAMVQASAGDSIAKPEQTAVVIAFLASNAPSFINSAILAADNGWLAA